MSDTKDIYPNLTTTEELIVEVLAARKLLGSDQWNFSTVVNKRANSIERTAASLKAKGLVKVETTGDDFITLSLTAKGLSLQDSYEYS